MKYFPLFSIAFCFLFFTACSPDLSSSVYTGGQVGVASRTVTGTIIHKRVVHIDNNSQMGGVVGAVGGAVAGSAIGNGTRAALLGGLGGAVAGAYLGHIVDKGIHSQQGYEYIIRVRRGQTISVTQAADSNFSVGQRVMVIYGNPVRIVPQ